MIGCNTFPTWNGYPGLFASLATGNPVLVKPHPRAVLPLALTVQVAREVLAEAGFDPNLVALAAERPGEGIAKTLAVRPEVRIIDYTGSTAFGDWLEANARQAQVYTEKAGVNTVVVDSTDDYGGMLRQPGLLAVPLQRPDVHHPAEPADPARRHRHRRRAQVLRRGRSPTSPARSTACSATTPGRTRCSARSSTRDVKARLEAAAGLGEVALASREVANPEFPDAVGAYAGDGQAGRAPSRTAEAALSLRVLRPGVLRRRRRLRGGRAGPAAPHRPGEGRDDRRRVHHLPGGRAAVEEVCLEECAQLSLNLTGGVYVNQTAAFSDFHGSGGNPAANAALCDGAFVANRRVVVGAA